MAASRLLAARLLAAALLSAIAACRAEIPPPGNELEAGSLSVNGHERSYHLFLPQAANAPVPLVMVFHGGLGDGLKVAAQTAFHRLAAREGFAVVYPDATGQWGDGRATTAQNASEDLEFVLALRARLIAERGVDPRRVYATGPSNGGMFTLRLACEEDRLFAAFAPVIASFPEPYFPRCQPARPVAMMLINGTDDPFIHWEGGEIPKGRYRGAGGRVIPVPETIDFWRRVDGCGRDARTTQLPDSDPDDGTTVAVRRYADCRDGVSLVSVQIAGGGHTWAGTPADKGPLMSMLVGNTSRDINATSMIWDFLRQYALPDDGTP